MSCMKEKRYKLRNCHMTLEDRIEIESGLRNKESLSNIARVIDKDVGTVRKEIKKHRTKKMPSSFNGKRNMCALYMTDRCRIHNLCSVEDCNKFCKNCFRIFCNDICEQFEEYFCENLLHKPYVCNGCDKKNNCHYIKMYYYAKDADLQYHNVLKNSRNGPRLTDEERNYLNNNVVPLVKNGQSFDHILMSDNNINKCKQTLYNYTEKGYLNLKNSDLPKKVTYKGRRKKCKNENENIKINQLKETRNYDVFKLFCEQHPEYHISEMDTVEGVKGGKLILTLLFRDSNFMIAYLIDNKMAETVNNKLSELKKLFTPITFKLLFQILLTDNGVEFTMIEEIEKLENSQKINLFFCDPGKSGQKGKIEKNHEEIRKILPKKTSFDNLTQDDLNLIMSHVNSYKRRKLGGKSPAEMVIATYGVELLELLNYKLIDSKDIILNPKLIKK